MLMRPLFRLLALAVIATTTGCSDKSAPNADNFAAAVNQKLASSQPRCLPTGVWPATSDPTDHGNPYAFYDAGMGFVQAGLATVKEEGPNSSTSFRKQAIFTLTDEGKKLLVPNERQPFPGKLNGAFCYGKARLTKVLNWDEPMKLGGTVVTTVTYSYEMTDVPKWAENKQLQTSFPILGTDVTGRGKANLGVSLTDGHWQPAT
ncbi:hypothetical protein [Paraburkholderia atlantica]|uniref:hypothetical protein n=1 Tax=Paraburkholderia atlantica TaxID=2654982 RepID=UPI0016187DAE|nr:hypothetical protein [Paraburkholderia atlantica]MBB5510625.1 hypothetical protein [Paraburkholderia atlantica]